MKTQIEFKSNAFPPYPDEGGQVNPGRYGKRLAEFLAGDLGRRGFDVQGVRPEDWGWAVDLKNDDFPLWVGCGNYEEFADGFLCFIEPSKPTIKKGWLSKIETVPTVERLASALEMSLS
jgi:hypothetical protein